MPLQLTASCFSKIQIGFSFLVPAHPGSPGKRAVKRVCVCVCVCSIMHDVSAVMWPLAADIVWCVCGLSWWHQYCDPCRTRWTDRYVISVTVLGGAWFITGDEAILYLFSPLKFITLFNQQVQLQDSAVYCRGQHITGTVQHPDVVLAVWISDVITTCCIHFNLAITNTSHWLIIPNYQHLTCVMFSCRTFAKMLLPNLFICEAKLRVNENFIAEIRSQ